MLNHAIFSASSIYITELLKKYSVDSILLFSQSYQELLRIFFPSVSRVFRSESERAQCPCATSQHLTWLTYICVESERFLSVLGDSSLLCIYMSIHYICHHRPPLSRLYMCVWGFNKILCHWNNVHRALSENYFWHASCGYAFPIASVNYNHITLSCCVTSDCTFRQFISQRGTQI